MARQTTQQSRTLVTTKELTAMQIAFVATDIFLSYPQFTSEVALEASWMIPLLSGLLALVVFLLMNWMIQRFFPNMDIVDIANSTLGSVVGILVAIVFSLYFLVYMAIVMRMFMENVITTVLPNTPILVVGALFTVTVGYFAFLGIEPICRTAYLFVPLLLIGVVGLCLLTVNQWHPDYLLPIWGNGVSSVLRGTGLYWPIYINVLFLVIFYPHARNPEKMGKMGIMGIVVLDLLLTVFLLVYDMVFPPLEAEHIAFPFYQLARLIYIGRFLQRLESIFIFLWVFMAVVRMSTLLWASVFLLSRAFQWPVYRPAVPAMAMLAFALSLVPKTMFQADMFAQSYMIPWGGIIAFGLPVMITVLAAIIKRSKTQRRLQGA